MEELLQKQTDTRTGRIYIEYKGVKYWFWEKRGLYCSQKGGKQTFLHYAAFWDGVEGHYPHPKDFDYTNLSEDNWYNSTTRTPRKPVDKPHQVFDHKTFYRREDNGYYYSKTYGFMHRYVWKTYNGEIPEGFHIHHKDGDRSNNDISNLELLSASEHSKLHAKDNAWVKSEACKKLLSEIREKTKAWHKSEEGRQWHRMHAKKFNFGCKEYGKRICEWCGKEFVARNANQKFCCSNHKSYSCMRRKKKRDEARI